MTRKLSSIIAMILFILPILPAKSSSLDFEQISWVNSDGTGYTSRYSDWGQVKLSLSSSDHSLFYPMSVQKGAGQWVSGYGGYVNIVTDSGGSADWEVKNLPFFYENAVELDGRLPQGAWFDLGVTPGTPLTSLNYYYTVDSAPLASMPSGSLANTTVSEFMQFLSGDRLWLGQSILEGGGLAAPQAAMDFQGAESGEVVGWVGTISVPETSIGAVNEDDNGCAPGAVARSIKYMADNHSNVNVPASVQQVYSDLRTDMGTTANGTMTDDILKGKIDYVLTNGLPIISTQTQSFQAAMDTLNRDGDVEIGVFWGEDGEGDSLGGHRAFVSEVQELHDAGGNVTGYVVRTIDDPDQTDNSAENSTHTLKFDANGNLVQYDGGSPPGTGGSLINFQIEDVRESMDNLAFRYGGLSIFPVPPGGGLPSPVGVGIPSKPGDISGVCITYNGVTVSGNPGSSLILHQLVVNPTGGPDTSESLDVDLDVTFVPGDPAAPTILTAELNLGHVLPDGATPGRLMAILSDDGEVILENLVATSSFFDVTYQVQMPDESPQVFRLHGEIAEDFLGKAWFLDLIVPDYEYDPEAWIESFFDVFFEVELTPDAYGLLAAEATLVNMHLYGDQTGLPGDVNGDGWVSETDLTTIINHWGETTLLGRVYGDLNGNGVVDGPDYAEVLSYWAPPEPPSQAIPEPATLGLLLVGGLALLRRQK